jgi:hypothetical protein
VHANAPRWQANAGKPFNEAWYAVVNDPREQRALWVRYTFDSPDRCRVWGAWFSESGCFALRAPIDAAAISRTILADDCLGEVAGDGHSLRWNLRFDHDPPGASEDFVPNWLRPVAAISGSGFVLPRPATTVSGTAQVDGILYNFDKAPAAQAHLWGKSRYPAWAWARCSAFAEDPDASIDLLDVVGPLRKRVPMIVLRLHGEVHRFGELPWIAFTRSQPSFPSWRFSARNSFVQIDGEVRAATERMVQVEYDPHHFCCNSELAAMGLRVRLRGQTLALTSRAANLEFAGARPLLGERS